MKYKNTIKAVVFMCILAILIFVTDRVTRDDSRETRFVVSATAANRVINERENSLDVIFVGDSLVTNGVSPYELWGNEGISSYVCGSSGQYLYQTYDYLEKVFKWQNPKVVVLETDALFRHATLEHHFTIRTAEYIPLINNHDKWKGFVCNDSNYKAYDYEYQNQVDEFKGYFHSWAINPVLAERDYMKNSNFTRELSLPNKVLLKSIVNLCEENDAELLLVSIPSPYNYTNGRRKGILKIADEYGLEFIDYNVGELKEEINLDWKVDTRDAGDHLSYKGMRKLCKHLGGYLSEHYELEDHREDEAYSDWVEGYRHYKEDLGM